VAPQRPPLLLLMMMMMLMLMLCLRVFGVRMAAAVA